MKLSRLEQQEVLIYFKVEYRLTWSHLQPLHHSTYRIEQNSHAYCLRQEAYLFDVKGQGVPSRDLRSSTGTPEDNPKLWIGQLDSIMEECLDRRGSKSILCNQQSEVIVVVAKFTAQQLGL